jgi:hypothetical protein
LGVPRRGRLGRDQRLLAIVIIALFYTSGLPF